MMTAEEFARECETRDGDPLWLAAREWIHAYPDVWRLIQGKALRMVKEKRRFSFKALIEHVRWTVQYEHDEEWKLNNTHTAYLAREFVRNYPDALNFVELRRSPCVLDVVA